MSKTKIPSKMRVEILNRDGNKCLWCGRSSADGITLHIDHIVAEHFKGSTTHDNLGTLCNGCNLGKSSQYYGNYLLLSLQKIPELDEKIIFKKRCSPNSFDSLYEYRIEFYRKKETSMYDIETVRYAFKVNPALLTGIQNKDKDCEIKFELEKIGNLLEFKDKLKSFLFEYRGYLKMVKGDIVFMEKQ